MSHFAVLALVGPEDAKSWETLEKKVAELLAPYDEGAEVERHRKEEGPFFTTAKKIEWMIGFYGFREKLEEAYPTTYGALTNKGGGWSPGVGDDHLRRILRRNIEGMGEIERLLEEHGPPRADDPEGLKRWYARDWAGEELRFDPEDGTPFAMTTYNPRSKWDSYRIGGGWAGMLGGHDPAEDVENCGTCRACGDMGRRDDWLGVRRLEQSREHACIWCDGEGWHTECPARFQGHEGDVQPVASVLKRVEECVSGGSTESGTLPQVMGIYPAPVPPMIPFAVLTPDGEWHQDVELDRFGIPDGEPDPDEWTRTVTGILAEHEDCYAVVVDCHI